MGSLSYKIRQSARSRRMSIVVHENGEVEVVVPKGGLYRYATAAQVEARAEQFVRSRRAWIEATLEKMQKRMMRRAKQQGKLDKEFGGPAHEVPRLRRGTRAYEDARKRARVLADERLRYFKHEYMSIGVQVSYGSISIRNQKTRWGSCSAKNDLSFNYRIAFLPPHLADYIIVHELCHTKEHNHSKKFWDLVSKMAPDHAKARKELRYRYQF